jgi:transcriptional regulator with XRE-family HTH domain
VDKSIYTRKYEEFLELMIKARKKANITQIELSAKLGKPQSFVSKYENGERRLDVVEFIQICKFIHVDPAKIVSSL